MRQRVCILPSSSGNCSPTQSGFLTQEKLRILPEIHPLLVQLRSFSSQKTSVQAMRTCTKGDRQTDIKNALHDRNIKQNDFTYHVENIFLN